MIIAGCGIHRVIGNDPAVDLYIDLINAVTQILIMIRCNAIVFQQTFLKLRFPCLIIGRGVCICCRALISRCIYLIRRFNLLSVETDNSLLLGAGDFPQAVRESTITAVSTTIISLYFMFL